MRIASKRNEKLNHLAGWGMEMGEEISTVKRYTKDIGIEGGENSTASLLGGNA